jgi:hypothetical protein
MLLALLPRAAVDDQNPPPAVGYTKGLFAHWADVELSKVRIRAC